MVEVEKGNGDENGLGWAHVWWACGILQAQVAGSKGVVVL